MAVRVAVGFVGLGNMGSRMAANMAARFGAAGALAEHRLVVFDVRGEPARELVAGRPAVASAAATLEGLAGACRTVVLCLPSGGIVRNAVAAMAPHLQAGSVVVDCSTTSHEDARAAAAELGTRNVAFLDAPVTGAPERAATGTLTTMVGGDSKHLDEVRPVLETFASRVLHVGAAVGCGQVAKSLNNCLYNVNCAAMAEVLPLAKRAGLELEPFMEVVTSGTGQSYGFNHWAPRALRREFEAPKHGYPMGEAFKDLETLAELAESLGTKTPPVIAAARETYERALAMGLGGEHKGAMVKVWERELGATCAGDGGTEE